MNNPDHAYKPRYDEGVRSNSGALQSTTAWSTIRGHVHYSPLTEDDDDYRHVRGCRYQP